VVTQGLDGPVSYHSVRRDQWPNVSDSTASLAADPPWVEGFVPGDAPTDVRPAPPVYGVPMHATCIELVHGSTPRILIDGVPIEDSANHKFFLPRFRGPPAPAPAPPPRGPASVLQHAPRGR
jgi:hypothetical protein